jgi:hypothetical protein
MPNPIQPKISDEKWFNQEIPEQSWTNKRKSTRYVRNDIGITINKVGLLKFSFLKNVATPVKLIDISSRGVGVLVASNLRLSLKKRIHLLIRFADFAEFNIPSTVVRRSPGEVHVYGIKFDKVNNELANHLLKTQTNLTFK